VSIYDGVLESFLGKRRLLLQGGGGRERERESVGEMCVSEERGKKRAKHSVSSKRKRQRKYWTQ